MATEKSKLVHKFLATPARLIVHLTDEKGEPETLVADGGLMLLADHHVEQVEKLVKEHGRLDLAVALKQIPMDNVEQIIKAHQKDVADVKTGRPAAIQGAVNSEPFTPNPPQEISLEDNTIPLRQVQVNDDPNAVLNRLRARANA